MGLVGTGFMGKCHAMGYATAAIAFPLPVAFRREIVADRTDALAKAAREGLGFSRGTADWRAVVEDPAVDLVDITAPNALHREIALAAIAAGKHVYCEKPLAPRAADADEMADAAEKAGVKTQVGFNYLMNPLMSLAREIVSSGEIGEVYSYRGVHIESYMADPAIPFSFRNDPVGGGVLADLGSHALASAEFLLGPLAEVMGECRTVVPERPDPETGAPRRVETDDVTHAFLRFQSGVTGSLEANWCASGRTMQHDFAVYGSRGSLVFTGERLNELHLYEAAGAESRRGYRKIEAGPSHPPYAGFCPAPGHQLGFNDLKAIEIARFAEALAGRADEPFNFRKGARIQHLVEAIQRSSGSGQWVTV